MIPDAEKVIGNYLRAHASVVALGARVVGKTPPDTSTQWVRVTQLDDNAVGGGRSDHLIEFMIQVDCYAGDTGGQPEATLLSRTVRAALVDMPGVRGDAVVTGVQFLSAPRLPDTAFEPARERFARTALVWMHAAPEE